MTEKEHEKIKIGSLDPAFFEKANETAESWARLYRSTAPLIHSDVKRIIDEIYEYKNVKPPAIYFCQSPWQMCLMPSMMLCNNKLRDCLSDKVQSDIESLLRSNLQEQCGSILTDSLINRIDDQVKLNGIVDPGVSLWNFFDFDMCDKFVHPEVYEQMEHFEPLVWHEASQFYRRIIFQRQADILLVIKESLKLHPPHGLWPPVDREYQDFVNAQITEQLDQNQITRPHYFDASRSIWFALLSFLQEIVNDKCGTDLKLTRGTELMIDAMKNIHMFLPFENICFVSERPAQISLLGGGLHNTNGPAIVYADGFNIYYWRNVRIPREILEKGNATTYEDILKQENLELRRAMIEIYGEQRFIADSNVKPFQKDHYGTLYRRIDPGHDDVVMVRVKNRTKDEDGTAKDYWLRVPPGVRTAKEAVAWTFFMAEEDYQPTVES